jgi:hypothetical protein
MLVHQLGWVLATAALTGAAWSAARRIAGTVADALLVCAALAAGGVVIWTLALGLAGLSGSSVALALGPVLAGLAFIAVARRGPPNQGMTTAPRRAAPALWRAGWAALTPLERVATGTGLGLLCGAIVEVALQPGFGIDAVEYHLPTALGWLQSGHAGSAQQLTYDFPVGYYPLTTEVLLTWLLGLSRSFAPLAAVGPITAAVGALGLWRLLDLLAVARVQTWLATVAFMALPTVLFGVNTTGPGTDLSAVSWLLCGAALAASAAAAPPGAAAANAAGAPGLRVSPAGSPTLASRRVVLLTPALIAFGLGVGTKTTVAPLAVVVLVAVGWHVRASLRRYALPLAGGVAVSLAVGIPWYLRNWIVHGWPLWPFSAGPVGDRLPHTMKLFAYSFISRPRVTFDHTPGDYLKQVGGGVVMIGGALVAPLLARRRDVGAAAALALAALLAWAAAPFTGLAPDPLLDGLAITTVRYILSALAACLVAVSLMTRPGASRLARGGALALTAAALLWSLVGDGLLGYPSIPRPEWPLALAALGAVLAVGLEWRGARPSGATPIRLGGALVAAVGVALLATLAGPGWLAREARDGDPNAAVTAFMLSQPGFDSSTVPVSFAPAELSTLAGPRLTHPLRLIPAQETCARTRARLDGGWIVLRPHVMAAGILTAFRAPACLARVRPVYDDGTTVVYAPRPEASP